MDIILIGERVNMGGGSPAGGWARVYKDPSHYWRMMTQMKAFRWARGHERAERACWEKLDWVLGGVRVDHELNLLVPASRPGAWTLSEARLGSVCLMAACPKPALLVSCGSRVCKALSKVLPGTPYPQVPGAIVEVDGCGLWLTRIPHPSGRNLQWSNRDLINEISERFANNLTELLCEEAVV